MLMMILKMTCVTAVYIAVTVLIWRLWHRHTTHSLPVRLAVGVFYGLCSVISTHFGINYGDMMVLNVRDLGPLAAGLFFDPLAGLVAGVIGGVERFLVGQYLGIGSFTRIACGVSTVLAGILAAVLYQGGYRGKRPSVIHCLLIGSEMEVFHMYAVFITNRNNMEMAYKVVKTCALPMIAFTGIGLAACSAIIAHLAGDPWMGHLKMSKRDTPIDVRFQRWLLVITSFLFAVSLAVNYSLQTRLAKDAATQELLFKQEQIQFSFQEHNDPVLLKKELDESSLRTDTLFLLVDADQQLQYTCIDSPEGTGPADPQEVALMVEHAGGEPFSARLSQKSGKRCLCVSGSLSGPYYMLVGMPEETIYEARQKRLLETLFLEILIFTALYLMVAMLVSRLVVHNLEWVNQSLGRITAGRLNEVVAVEESSEFTKLSEDINKTVSALRELIDAAEKRMEEDLKLAADIQDAALPKGFILPSGNIELHALMDPARQVGGDFYDFFYVGPDQLALVIADVSGKGIPAALFMMRAKTAIKSSALISLSPAKILETVNNTLCEGNETKMFVTVWLGILDLNTGLMRCCNAGHEYPALMRAGGDYELLKDRHGLVLGAMPDIPRHDYEIQLEPGDRVYVYTDGVPEANNENREQYGTSRMTEDLNTLKNLPQEQVLNGMLEYVRQFAGEAEQFDDITMLGITYTRPEAES